MKRRTEYFRLSAWFDAREPSRARCRRTGRPDLGHAGAPLYTVPLTGPTNGWKHMGLPPSRPPRRRRTTEIRLYAPEGRVLWDSVRLAVRGRAAASARAPPERTSRRASIPESSATAGMAPRVDGRRRRCGRGCVERLKVAEAKALWRYIKRRPIYGYGFGRSRAPSPPVTHTSSRISISCSRPDSLDCCSISPSRSG